MASTCSVKRLTASAPTGEIDEDAPLALSLMAKAGTAAASTTETLLGPCLWSAAAAENHLPMEAATRGSWGRWRLRSPVGRKVTPAARSEPYDSLGTSVARCARTAPSFLGGSQVVKSARPPEPSGPCSPSRSAGWWRPPRLDTGSGAQPRACAGLRGEGDLGEGWADKEAARGHGHRSQLDAEETEPPSQPCARSCGTRTRGARRRGRRTTRRPTWRHDGGSRGAP